jgi:hypothetical protein
MVRMDEELRAELLDRAGRDQAARKSLAQHAPAELQEEWLPLLQDAVARGEASPADLAYPMDRARLLAGG